MRTSAKAATARSGKSGHRPARPKAAAAGQGRRLGHLAGDDRLLLGLNVDLKEPWPSQADVAKFSKVTRARVSQVVGKFQARWSKEPAITRLRPISPASSNRPAGRCSSRRSPRR